MTKEERKKYNAEYQNANRKKIKLQRKKYSASHVEELKITQHEQYLKHRTERLLNSNEYGKIHKTKILKQKKDFYLKNKEIILQEREKYYTKNRNKILSRHAKYIRNRRRNDINFKLRTNLSRRVYQVLKNNYKSSNTLKLIGCNFKQLRIHIENLFKSGMSWKNYGRGWAGKGMHEWHIDHIRPCASFDLSKESDQKKCFHYTNLQPLWAKENLSKSNNII